MNIFDGSGGKEAKLRYLDAEFQVITPGSFVRCAVTGQAIAIDDLKYWSVARQEPYADVEVSFKRELEVHPKLRKR